MFKLINDKKVLITLIGLWVLLICIIQPFVNFPLNDDWSYAYAVKSLVENGDLEYRGWMSMTLFAQVIWGALLSKIFGFSFTLLHISNSIIGLIGAFYSYKLVSFFRINKFIALLISVGILLNPIYLNLSFTFMTDVPFYTVSVISIYYFIKYIGLEQRKLLIIATLFSIVAILIRQLGLVIPLSFLIVGFYNRRWYCVYPFVISIVVFGIYQLSIPYFISDLGRSNEHNLLLLNNAIHHPVDLITNCIKRSIIFFVYFGLLFAPILVFLRLPKGKFVDWVLFVLSVISVGILYKNDFLMPLNKNIIFDFGIGPRTLYDNWVSKETDLRSMILFSKLQLTFVGVMYAFKTIEAVILKSTSLRHFSMEKNNEKRFVMFVGLIYLVLISSVDNFDRYYLLLFPLTLIVIANFLNTNKSFLEKFQWVFMMCILFTFTSIGNRDYFAFQKARWQGINYLTEELKIPTNKIDGGFEYNGWYNYNATDFENNVENLWVPDDEYKICFEKIDNYTIIKEIEYNVLLKFGKKKTIKVLKRNE